MDELLPMGDLRHAPSGPKFRPAEASVYLGASCRHKPSIHMQSQTMEEAMGEAEGEGRRRGGNGKQAGLSRGDDPLFPAPCSSAGTDPPSTEARSESEPGSKFESEPESESESKFEPEFEPEPESESESGTVPVCGPAAGGPCPPTRAGPRPRPRRPSAPPIGVSDIGPIRVAHPSRLSELPIGAGPSECNPLPSSCRRRRGRPAQRGNRAENRDEGEGSGG